jgi:hypothetical protein
LVTLEDIGFSLQLNSYPLIGAITPNSTPQTTFPQAVVGQLDSFQYLLIVANNQISYEIQYWANAKSRIAGQDFPKMRAISLTGTLYTSATCVSVMPYFYPGAYLPAVVKVELMPTAGRSVVRTM